MSRVRTVLGDVDSADLGLTLPHEHLANDISSAFRPAQDEQVARLLQAPVSASQAWLLRDHPYSSLDNCRLDDAGAVLEDLQSFRAVGGRTVVDLTPAGIGRDPGRLVELSRHSQVQVVMGSGWYLHATHPGHLATASHEELVQELLADFGDPDPEAVRPGVLGEIGVSAHFTTAEHTALRAACAAQRELGVPLFVHLPGWQRRAHEVLDLVLDEQGVAPAAVVLCHMDPSGADTAYQRAVADRGVWLEFDMLGMPYSFPGEGESPSADDSAAAIQRLIAAGHAGQLLLSHDLFLKGMHARHGGNGLTYVPVAFTDRLRRRGSDAATVRSLTTDNPRALFEAAAGGRP